jgi:hypothetical protein
MDAPANTVIEPTELSSLPSLTRSQGYCTEYRSSKPPIFHPNTADGPCTYATSESPSPTHKPTIFDGRELVCNNTTTDQGNPRYWMALGSMETARDMFCAWMVSQRYIIQPSADRDNTGVDYHWETSSTTQSPSESIPGKRRIVQ